MHLVSVFNINKWLDSCSYQSEKCDVMIKKNYGKIWKGQRCQWVTQSSPCSAVPSRFHVLHLHVKLDWLRENWTVNHSNTRAVFAVSPSLLFSFPSRYTLAGVYALSRRTQMCAPIVFAYFKLFRGRDAKWSVASAQWSDPSLLSGLSTPFLFFSICFSLSLLFA